MSEQLTEEFKQQLEQRIQEKQKAQREYRVPKDWTDKVYVHDVVILINGDKAYEKYSGDEFPLMMTPLAIIKMFGLKKKNIQSTAILILEGYLRGDIWQYNNYHDNKWHYHGETRGIA